MAGTNWNPNSSTLLGLEWKPNVATVLPLTDSTAGWQRFTASINETITQVRVPHGSAQNVDLGDLICDITQAGNEIPDTSTIVSNIFVAASSGTPVGWRSQVGDTAVVQAVDEGTASPNYDDFIIHGSSVPSGVTPGGAAYVDYLMNTSGFASGRRILNVDVRAWCRGGSIAFEFLYNGTLYARQVTGNNGVSGSTGFTRRVFSLGELCPWTRLPWTQANLRALSGSGTWGAQCSIRVSRADRASGFYSPTMAAFDIRVDHCAENRLAFAVGTASPGAVSSMLPVYKPDPTLPTATWAKANGAAYGLVVRRCRSLRRSAVVAWSRIESQAKQLPPSGLSCGLLNLGDWGEPATFNYPLFYAAYGFTLFTGTAPNLVASLDSQPYERVVTSQFAAGTQNRQNVTPASGMVIGVLRVLVKAPQSTDQLSVQVKTAAGAPVSTKEYIGLDDVARGKKIGNWTEVQIQFASTFNLAGNTAYYVEFIAAGPGWQSLVLAGAADGSNCTATWGGAGGAVVDGAVLGFAGDWILGLGTIPPSLLSVTAAQQNLPLAPPVDAACVVTQERIRWLSYARITWSSTALGSAFHHYEVQRWDAAVAPHGPGPTEWSVVGLITDPLVLRMDDFEARSGVTSAYRVRQVRTDSIASAWVGDAGGPALVTLDAVTATGTSPVDEGALLLSSNSRPDLCVAYPDIYSGAPARTYQLLEANEAVFHSVYGKDGQMVFRPTERRGVQFNRQLLLNSAISTTAHPGDVWGPALDLSLADIPYVCVRDRNGHRWYCAMQLAGATETGRGGDVVFADATFTQLEEFGEPISDCNTVLGYPWQSLRGQWGVDGTPPNQRAMLAATGGTMNVVAFDAHAADVVLQSTITWTGVADDYAGLAFRIADIDNFLLLSVNPTPAKKLQLAAVRNGAVQAPLWTSAANGASGALFKVDVSGVSPSTSVKIYEAGTLLATIIVSDSFFDGRTWHGLGFAAPGTGSGAAARWGAFSLTAGGKVVAADNFVR